MAGLAGGLFLLDRLFLAMEARGWIYYRKNKPKASALGTSLLELQSLLEPGKRHVIETREEHRKEEEDDAGPDDPARIR